MPSPDRSGVHDDWHVMVSAVRYDPATGAILSRCSMSVAALRHHEAVHDQAFLRIRGTAGRTAEPPSKAFADVRFVDLSGSKPRLRVKSACPAVLDGLTLKCLPVPCRIEIDVPLYPPRVYNEIASPELDLAFDHAGTFTVRVVAAAHTDSVFSVTVP